MASVRLINDCNYFNVNDRIVVFFFCFFVQFIYVNIAKFLWEKFIDNIL